MEVSSFGISDIGRSRHENQDHFLIDPLINLFIVADGMGGMRDGELAARYSVELPASYLRRFSGYFNTLEENVLTKLLYRAVDDLNQFVCSVIHKNMGSTLVFLLFCRGRAYVVNVGDSPALLYRKGHLQQISRDHNLAAAFVEAGILTPMEARFHPSRNSLTAFIGLNEQLPVCLKEVALEEQDIFVLCSDGLTSMLTDMEITGILAGEADVEAMGRKFIEMANDRGGCDNITALVVKVESREGISFL